MNFTEARSDVIVSPIAQWARDLAQGHCNVRVLLNTPLWSRVKLPDDCASATEFTIAFVEDCPAVVGDDEDGWSGMMVEPDEWNDTVASGGNERRLVVEEERLGGTGERLGLDGGLWRDELEELVHKSSGRVHSGRLGGVGLSFKMIRRSTTTLALRIDTSLSIGWRCNGIDTRSIGPIAVCGEWIEYRILGARGLLVCKLSMGSGCTGEGNQDGMS